VTFPELTEDQVRRYLTDGMKDWPTPQSIPVRLWPNPNTTLYGYLDIGESVSDGNTTRYEVTFRMAPLREPARFDMRLYPTEEAA
jgi:hypothetical protein